MTKKLPLVDLNSKIAVANILATVTSVKNPENPVYPNKSSFEIGQMVDMEVMIAENLAKAVTFPLKYLFPFPHKIIYTPGTRRFAIRKKSWLSWVICALWQALIIWRLSIKVVPNSRETSHGVLSGVVKLAYAVFIIYSIALFRVFWIRADNMVDILNNAIEFSRHLYLRFQSVPKTRMVFLATHMSWVFCGGFALVSHVIGGIVVIVSGVSAKDSDSLFDGYENYTDSRYSLHDLNPEDHVIVHILTVIANFLNTFCWTTSFLYIGVWALFYRHLYCIFFWRLRCFVEAGFAYDLPNEIRTFNRITGLVDKFNNEIGGFIITLGSLAAVLYVSTSVEQAITGVTNIAQFKLKIQLFMTYIPMACATLMVSDLHRKAGDFGNIIKELYANWRIAVCDTSEGLCGVTIVHHDLVTANIGFKGLGFFTVTYQFVATMLSLIITYSLVAIQLFPQITAGSGVKEEKSVE